MTLVNVDHVEGRGPDNELKLRSMPNRLVSRDKQEGKVPVILFIPKFKLVRAVMAVKVQGMVPLRLFEGPSAIYYIGIRKENAMSSSARN